MSKRLHRGEQASKDIGLNPGWVNEIRFVAFLQEADAAAPDADASSLMETLRRPQTPRKVVKMRTERSQRHPTLRMAPQFTTGITSSTSSS